MNELATNASITEVIQAGDVFLFKLNCPRCRSRLLVPHPFKPCDCGYEFSEEIEIPTRRKFRVLCGTMRNRCISKKIVRELLDLQGRECAYCCVSIENGYEVEHIMPLSCGGSNRRENLCLSCKPCNCTAGSKFFATMDRKRSYILNMRRKEVL